MIYLIPWSNSPAFEQTLRLSGELYRLVGRWNALGFWTLDIFDKNDAPLLLGQKIVINTDILARYQDTRLPPGKLFAVSTGGDTVGRNDIGASVQLVYQDV